MRRTFTGAVLALVVAVGLSACGNAHTVRSPTMTTRTTTVAKVAPVDLGSDVNFVVLPPMHGAGDETLGTFTTTGSFGYIEAQCTGEGSMKVAGMWTVPCSAAGAQLGFDTPGQRIHLAVRAKPGTTWWLAIGEHIPSLVRDHRTLVLLHRSGVGSKSLGTFHFHLQGTVRVATSCTGKGQFTVRFTSTAPAYFPDESTYCPENQGVGTSRPPAGARDVDVSVQAGRKASWTLTISETIVGDATSTKR
jgi:hypothetical protein